jgi:hypothetical protein
MVRIPKTWTTTARRLLVGQLDRLHEFLGRWGRCLRDQLAGAIGEAVTGVFRALLENSSDVYSDSGPTRRYPDWGTSSWRDPYGEPSEDPGRPSWRDAGEDRWQDEPDEPAPGAAADAPDPVRSRWRPTLAAALQALAWWLRQPTLELSGRAALAAGMAGCLALTAGVPLAGVAALAGSALGLLTLTEAARTSVAALAAAASP